MQHRENCPYACHSSSSCGEGLSDSKRRKVRGISNFTQFTARGLHLIALLRGVSGGDLTLDQTAYSSPSLLTLCFSWCPSKQDPQSFPKLVPKHSLTCCIIKRLQFLKPGRSTLFFWQLEKGRSRSLRRKWDLDSKLWDQWTWLS